MYFIIMEVFLVIEVFKLNNSETHEACISEEHDWGYCALARIWNKK